MHDFQLFQNGITKSKWHKSNNFDFLFKSFSDFDSSETMIFIVGLHNQNNRKLFMQSPISIPNCFQFLCLSMDHVVATKHTNHLFIAE